MKIKFTILALVLAITSGSMALAEETNSEGNFKEHKAERIKNLNEEKAGIDQVISCINSAKNQDDMKKCNEVRRENIKKLRERSISERKERLQDQINKLDEKSKELESKEKKQ